MKYKCLLWDYCWFLVLKTCLQILKKCLRNIWSFFDKLRILASFNNLRQSQDSDFLSFDLGHCKCKNWSSYIAFDMPWNIFFSSFTKISWDGVKLCPLSYSSQNRKFCPFLKTSFVNSRNLMAQNTYWAKVCLNAVLQLSFSGYYTLQNTTGTQHTPARTLSTRGLKSQVF